MGLPKRAKGLGGGSKKGHRQLNKGLDSSKGHKSELSGLTISNNTPGSRYQALAISTTAFSSTTTLSLS